MSLWKNKLLKIKISLAPFLAYLLKPKRHDSLLQCCHLMLML